MTGLDGVFGSKRKSRETTLSVMLVNFKCPHSHLFLPSASLQESWVCWQYAYCNKSYVLFINIVVAWLISLFHHLKDILWALESGFQWAEGAMSSATKPDLGLAHVGSSYTRELWGPSASFCGTELFHPLPVLIVVLEFYWVPDLWLHLLFLALNLPCGLDDKILLL